MRAESPSRLGLEIYPSIWDDGDEDLIEELLESHSALRTLVDRAAEQGAGLLVYIE